MAERTFDLPDLGEGLTEAVILEWLVDDGATVERGNPIVEVETTKSAAEIPSPIAGVVAKRFGDEGETLQVGDPLITFTVPDEEAGIVGTVPQKKAPSRRVKLRKPGS